MPEDELQPATPPNKEEIIDYLKSAGLVAMLRAISAVARLSQKPG